MHPLRFPNSGIRASEGNKEEGRPTTASPMQGRPPMAKPQPRPPTRGSSLYGRLAPLARAAAHKGGAYGHDRLWPSCRGGSRPWAHLQRGSAAGLPQGAASHD
ncbi:hypothetical protein GW17_00061624 [Ensete ventricosum]|nr:hypothetical protein GW17_00061624 [Ensete ventricosum]